jgi:hypothetical protein
MYLIPAGLDGSVEAVVMTATAQAEAPVVAGDGAVVAVEATATAEAHVPTVLGEEGGSPEVAAQVMTASAQAEAPTVTVDYTASPPVMTAAAEAVVPELVGVTVLIFNPPTRREHYGTKQRDPLTVRIGYPTGQTVLKVGGFYTTHLVHEVSDEMIQAADVAYVGGHDYVISDDEAEDLTAAGYGSYITSRAQ